VPGQTWVLILFCVSRLFKSLPGCSLLEVRVRDYVCRHFFFFFSFAVRPPLGAARTVGLVLLGGPACRITDRFVPDTCQARSLVAHQELNEA
jgi:hypothetical protein